MGFYVDYAASIPYLYFLCYILCYASYIKLEPHESLIEFKADGQ